MDAVAERTAALSDLLRLAASKGQLDSVRESLQAGATLDPDQDGRTALHYAALNGYADVTRFLVEKGCNINLQDDSGYTALHRAASQGHVEVITMLLERGCDVNTQDEHGNAAIHEASWNGFSKTLELLVKYDANCSIVNKAGFTALHLSAQNGHNETSRVLLYAGCNADLKNNYGDTTLHTAARYGHAGVTRILISARSKLNDQNKNGDTALHIAAALKRRKIAKLLVDCGIDVNVRNKQNENAVEVARRKDHDEIISIVQTFCKPVKQPLKEVNFNMDVHEIDGPVIVPDIDIPEKTDSKPEKSGKRFLFFKKKKSKDKDKSSSQKTGPPTGVTGQCQLHRPGVNVGHRPVQGFFSKYVPREGVQYYRDLAGNVKQGPVGYTPSCSCLPALNQLQKEVHDNQDHVYGHIQTNNRLMHNHINQVEQRSSRRVQSLEQYTKDCFMDEETMCRQRTQQQFQQHHAGMYGNVPDAHMKSQIQNWLEQKLEGYGHCLHHHHDDTALPNENIFSDVHETANGRLFKSRSDETLSQSDNHSGRFRKREFYESRQEAMQQIRAWQVPTYSKDRNRVKVYDRKVERNHSAEAPSRRSQGRQQVNGDSETHRPYSAERSVDPHRGYGNMTSAVHHNGRISAKQQDDHTYMTMTGVSGAVPRTESSTKATKPVTMPQPQVYQSVRTVSASRGPVNHSTPKSTESSPYTTHRGILRNQTDPAVAAAGTTISPRPQRRQLQFNDTSNNQSMSHHTPQHSYSSVSFDVKRDANITGMSSNEHQPNRVPSANTAASPVKSPGVGHSVNQSMVNSVYHNSSNSVRQVPETPKPTFTTFGYDDTLDGSTAPANSPERMTDHGAAAVGQNGVDSPRSAANHSNHEDHKNRTQLSENSLFSRQSSHESYGFSPRHDNDDYVEMHQLPMSSRMHQRTQSSEGLLETDLDCVSTPRSIDYVNPPRSRSEDRIIDSRNSVMQSPVTSRSVSESRGGLHSPSGARPMSPSSPQKQCRNVAQPGAGAYSSRITPQSMYTNSPFPVPNRSHNQPQSQERPSLPPKPSNPAKTYPYTTSAGEVKHDRVYTGSISLKTVPRSGSTSMHNKQSDNMYSSVKSVQQNRNYNPVQNNNHQITVTADVHSPASAYYGSQAPVNGVSTNTVANQALLEPRSKTAYQTYLTETPHVEFANNTTNGHDRRESSPNICNNSKEDSSSNPGSGYSSKIYGNRAGSVQPASCGSTPSSSFSTDRGLTSYTNSPQSQYSNTDYEYLPKQGYDDEVQSHINTWYQRKLQETTQKVYDNWRSERSPGAKLQQQQRLPVSPRYYGNGDFSPTNQVSALQTGAQLNGETGYSMSGQKNHMVSTYVVHGSDV